MTPRFVLRVSRPTAMWPFHARSPSSPVANAIGLGSIRSSSLEKSNVDLAQQFVNLIVSQRAFQANTRTVSVANELMANLVAPGQ